MKFKLIHIILLLLFRGTLFAQSITVTLKVTAITGENLSDTPVRLEHLDYGIIYPTNFLSDKGECIFKNVLEGKNQLNITKEGLAVYSDNNLVISKDTTLHIILQEPVRKPYALKTETKHNAHTGQTNVLLNWNKETDYFFDDFESYEPFSIRFTPWTGIDGDKAPTARLSGSYPNSELPQYATIFNPLTISPPVWYEYPVLRPYSGKQYAAFIRTADGSANNDWLISPRIKVGVNNVVRFLAKAGDVYKEQFKVAISTTGTEMKDFRSLTSGNYEQVDYKQWKNIQYDLSEYEGKEVYIAIQYISKAFFMLMVDDFYVGPRNIEPSKQIKRRYSVENPSEKFVVYCNNDSIDTVTETAYLFKNLEGGNNTLGVKAVYKVSQSEIADISTIVEDASNYAAVRINLTINNGIPADGLIITYINRSTGELVTDTINNGISELKSLHKGEYIINLPADGYEPYTQTILIDKNITIDVQLKELIVPPYNITTDLTPGSTGGKTDALLKWNQDLGFSDGFERYPDFSQTFGDWTTVDGDKMIPYGVSLGQTQISFPGANEPSACMVFNAKATTPSMEADGAILAPEGEKCIIFFSAQSGQSDDWLIAPAQKIREGYVLRFLAKSYSAMYPETFEIAVSDKKDLSTITVLDEVMPTDSWIIYEVDLSDYAGQNIYPVIHYKSYDKFMMLFDSFYVGPGKESSGTVAGNAIYEIWLDGVKKATTKENHYLFEGLDDGVHQAGIKAIYASGTSEMVPHSFICNASSVGGTLENGISVYSNNGNISILSPGQETAIEVYTATGQLLHKSQSTDKTVSLSVPPGIYIVTVYTSGKKLIYKSIVR